MKSSRHLPGTLFLPAIVVTLALRTAPLAGQHLNAWHRARSPDRTAGVDYAKTESGATWIYLKSAAEMPRSFGTLLQDINGVDYRDERLRLTGLVKFKNVEGWGGVWMRVDGPQGPLSFDNIENRPIKDTSDWTWYQVVLDAPPSANDIFFGLWLQGRGELWLRDLKLRLADASVPVTTCRPACSH